jgi:hypothetical protein
MQPSKKSQASLHSTPPHSSRPSMHHTHAPHRSISLYSALLRSTPLYSAPLHSTPLYSALLRSTPLHSAPLHSTPLHSALLRSTPLYSTPLHSTPPHSSPLCSTPLHSTELNSTAPNADADADADADAPHARTTRMHHTHTPHACSAHTHHTHAPHAAHARTTPHHTKPHHHNSGETEAERSKRVRTESGSRSERLRADRARDLNTSSKKPDLCSQRGVPRTKLWPPPPSKNATTPMAKLNGSGLTIT